MIKILIASILLLLFMISCEESIIPQDKSGLPADHTNNIESVFHRAGEEYPFAYDDKQGTYSCAGANCHGLNLRGGIAKDNDVKKVAPSCFQCHGDLWADIDTTFSTIGKMK